MKEKLRMCIVCKEMLDKKQLIRIVKNQSGEIFIDKTFKASGRGAYVCNKSECIENLKKTKALNRAFKSNISEDIYEKLKGELIG